MQLVAFARRRRCPAFTPVVPRATKACDIRPTPPTVEEIVTVMRITGDGLHDRRLRGLIVVLWRIHEALALRKPDLDRRRGSLLVRRRKRPCSCSPP